MFDFCLTVHEGFVLLIYLLIGLEVSIFESIPLFVCVCVCVCLRSCECDDE